MHSVIMFVYVTFLNFICNEELLGWRPDLSIGCRIGLGCATVGRALAQIPKPTSMGGLSPGPPELCKSVAAGNVKSHPWVDEVSGFRCPRVIWTKSLSYAFICIPPRKKPAVKISMNRSLSDVYAGVTVQLFFLTHKCFFKWKDKGDSSM